MYDAIMNASFPAHARRLHCILFALLIVAFLFIYEPPGMTEERASFEIVALILAAPFSVVLMACVWIVDQASSGMLLAWLNALPARVGAICWMSACFAAGYLQWTLLLRYLTR